MRYPGFVAKNPVDVTLANGARLYRRKVRTDVWLSEYRGREHFTGGNLRQPFLLLSCGAAAENQFRGDLRASAERADADVATREFFRYDAHRLFAQLHAAEFLGNGETEHTEVGHLRNDIERNVAVGPVPALRASDHLAIGEFAHLVADRVQRLVKSATADRNAVVLAYQFDQARAPLGGIAVGKEALDHRIDACSNLSRRQAEIGRAHNFALAHRNAANDLGNILA